MIAMNESNYIGQGLHRKCYHHPQDANRCVKVNYNDGAEEETNREVAYYKHLIKRNVEWSSLPKYYGSVATNFGEGQVFELIRDYDGQTSMSLESYLQNQQLTEHNYHDLVTCLNRLKADLLKNRIITMTIKSKNILFQRVSQDQNRLVIIDNIGNATLFPIANYCNYFAKAKIERAWQRFIKSLLKENANSAVAVRLVNEVAS